MAGPRGGVKGLRCLGIVKMVIDPATRPSRAQTRSSAGTRDTKPHQQRDQACSDMPHPQLAQIQASKVGGRRIRIEWICAVLVLLGMRWKCRWASASRSDWRWVKTYERSASICDRSGNFWNWMGDTVMLGVYLSISHETWLFFVRGRRIISFICSFVTVLQLA